MSGLVTKQLKLGNGGGKYYLDLHLLSLYLLLCSITYNQSSLQKTYNQSSLKFLVYLLQCNSIFVYFPNVNSFPSECNRFESLVWFSCDVSIFEILTVGECRYNKLKYINVLSNRSLTLLCFLPLSSNRKT